MNNVLGAATGFGDVFSMQIEFSKLLVTLALGLAVGLFVFFIYRLTFSGVLYSRNLNISYVILCVVTALMLMLINNNLTLSLGMVGALSIIRFRTAVKDPLDTVYMFWAVGEGIAVGTAYYLEAIIAAVIIGAAMVILNLVRRNGNESYLLIVHYDERGREAVDSLLGHIGNYKVKSKVAREGVVELTAEVRLKNRNTRFIEKLSKYDGVGDVTLITHKGDIVA